MAQENAGHADILVERSRLCNAKGAGPSILTKIAIVRALYLFGNNRLKIIGCVPIKAGREV
jgi:hypothetical protein